MFFFFFRKCIIFIRIFTEFIKLLLYCESKSLLFSLDFHVFKIFIYIIFFKKQLIKFNNLTDCFLFYFHIYYSLQFQKYLFSKLPLISYSYTTNLILYSYTTNFLLFFFILTRNLLSDFHTLNIISAA